MLRMDGFEVELARSPEEAVERYHRGGQACYIAGGTDLLPNLKHRILRPQRLVAIGAALPQGWTVGADEVIIGAGTRLSRLAGLTELPALAQAAGLVAGPQIRNMGTIGGNILLDTRCLYYNQSEFWRQALGHCLKAEGDWCHVVGGPKTCVATQSSDTVPALLSLDARIGLLGPQGARELPLRQLYQYNGMDWLRIAPGELLTHVLVPRPAANARGSYQKLRTRGAIDFPQLGVAIQGRFEGRGPSAVAQELCITIGAINPQPRPLPGLDPFIGQALSDEAVHAIGELAFQRSRPQGSVAGDLGWRRRMAAVFVRRGLLALRDAGQV